MASPVGKLAVPGCGLLAAASPLAEQSIEKFAQLLIAQTTDGTYKICPTIIDGV